MTEECLTLGSISCSDVDRSGPELVDSFTYVDISSIDREAKRITSPKVMERIKAPSRAKQKLRTGDVLISMTRPNLNAVALVPSRLDGSIGSTGFHVVRPKWVMPEFVYYCVQTREFIDAMAFKVQGALYPAVRPADISSFIIPPFSLSRQKRIVAKIEELFSELDAGIESIKQARAQLGVYRQALLKKAFEGQLTAQWRAQQHPSVSATPPSPLSRSHLPFTPPPSPLSRSHLPFTGEELYEASPQNSHQNSPPFQGGVPEGRGGSGVAAGRGGSGRGGCQTGSSQEVEYPADHNREANLAIAAEPHAAYLQRGYPAINNLPHLKTFRKQLRSKMTPAEARLWTHLKGKQLDGRKFRRQHSVANYILDFYCPEERLAIELDGEVHNNVVASEYDYERDLFLQHTGIKVLRFENRIVFENSAWLLDQIKSNFTTPPSPPPRSHLPFTTPPSPLPRSHLPLPGEELYEASPQNSPQNSPPLKGGVAEGRGGSGVPEGRGGCRGGSGCVAESPGSYTPKGLPTAEQLLERIRTERHARYEQQLDEWRTATADWEKYGKQGKKPAKPRPPKPVEPLSPEERAELPPLPEGWTWVTLSNLGELERGKSKHRPRNDPKLFGGKYPFVQTGDVKSALKTIQSYKTTYNEDGLQQSRLWPEGTLCITIAANIAQTAFLGFDACFPDSIVGFVPIRKLVEDEYVELFMQLARHKLEEYAPATAQKNINLTTLENLVFPLCSLPEQREIVRILEEQFAVIEQNEQEIDAALTRAEALRQAILKKAFSGKLVPQDPNDEPASALLDRIRAERATTTAKPPRKPPKSKSPAGGKELNK